MTKKVGGAFTCYNRYIEGVNLERPTAQVDCAGLAIGKLAA